MPITTPFVVSPFNAGDNDIRPSMTRLPNGDIVVVYEHYNGAASSLAIRVLRPDGTPVTAEIFDTIGGYGALPRVVAIDATHFAIVASDFGTVSGAVELTAQVFTINGANLTQGGEIPISNYASTNDDNGNDHQILRLPDGNFLVVWAQFTNGFGNAQLVARTFDAAFNPLTPETRISEFNNTGVSNPQVTLDGHDVVVSWNQNDPTTGGSTHARLAAFTVGAGGVLPGSPPNDIDVGNNTAVRSITHLANGDVLVLYIGGPVQGGSLDDNDKLSAKIYSSDLSTVKATLQINAAVDDNGVTSVAVVAFASGGFQVIWGQDPAGGTNPSQDFELFSRSYNYTYTPVSAPVLLTDNAVADTSPAAVVDANGNVTITWETTNASGSGSIVGLYLEDQDPGLPNQAPAGADYAATLAEDGVHTFAAAEFGFSDPDGDALAAVVFTTLPANGAVVVVDANGAVVQTLTAGQSVTAAQLAAGLVRYRPDANESGDDFDSFTFQVRDDGGVAAGGVDRDQTPNTFTFDVTAVNDAPTISITPTDGAFTENGADVGLFSGASVTNPEAGEELTLTFRISGVVDGSNERLMLSGVPIDLVAGSPFIQPAPGGAVMGQVTATATPGVFTLVLVGVSSNSHAQQILNAITYRNVSEAPTAGDRLVTLVSIRDNGGGSNSTTVNQTATVTVVPVDDAAAAADDAASTREGSPLAGSVFGNDGDVDGPALQVGAVNGAPGDVGVQITLPSGALLTLNADGTYTYDPNGAFDEAPDPGSGGTPLVDSFTYTLVGGGTATVTITIVGDDGDDTVNGDGGDNVLDGGDGDDVVSGGGGNDVLDGGSGFDTVDYGGAGSGVIVRLNTGVTPDDGDGGSDTLAGFENIDGSAFNDILVGAAGANVLRGGAGQDYLVGLDGNDVLFGGSGAPNQLQGGTGDDDYHVDGNDTLVEFAGEGHDRVFTTQGRLALAANLEDLIYVGTGAFFGVGNALDNALTGGAGDDVLSGGGGDDALDGGDGVDTASYGLASGGVVAHLDGGHADDGDGGTDALTGIENLLGSAHDDLLHGDAGGNVLDGATGDDLLVGGAGNDVLRGGGGYDTVDYGAAASGVFVKLNTGRASDGDGGVDALISVEEVRGSAHDDVLVGNYGDNALHGLDGADYLVGLEGDDRLYGGAGAPNQLQGGLGDDHYYVDANDTLIEFGNEGRDHVHTTLNRYTLGDHFEDLTFTGPGGFVGSGNALNNLITGGSQADILRGGGGDDVIDGGLGMDEVQLRGVAANYTITAEGAGWRIVDNVAGRDGSTLVTSIEVLRFANNTTLTLTYPPAAPAAPEPAAKDFGLQVLPSLEDDAFVLPAPVDDEPLVLPGAAAAKASDEPLVLPGTDQTGPLFHEAWLAHVADRMPVVDPDGRIADGPAHREEAWIF